MTDSPITIRVKAFARYAEVLGAAEVEVLVTPPARVGDVVAALRAQSPQAALLPEQPMVSVNLEHVLADHPVAEGDELALLPPLAGG